MKKLNLLLILLFFLGISLMFPVSNYAQRGCCSHHGGVDYCDSSVGSLVCNDGTYSPSCTCYQEPQQSAVLPTPGPNDMKEFLDEFVPDPSITPTPTATLLEASATYASNNWPLLIFGAWIIFVIVSFVKPD